MKWSTVTVGVMILGIIGVSIILLFQQLTTTNENDYYLLKEITEAAMIDATDIGYYRMSGGLYRIDKEKFVESFLRRFSQNVVNTRNYDIKFYDINETPPKVTIKVDSDTSVAFNDDQLHMSNKITSIMETDYETNELTTKLANSGKLDYSKIDEVYTKLLATS